MLNPADGGRGDVGPQPVTAGILTDPAGQQVSMESGDPVFAD